MRIVCTPYTNTNTTSDPQNDMETQMPMTFLVGVLPGEITNMYKKSRLPSQIACTFQAYFPLRVQNADRFLHFFRFGQTHPTRIPSQTQPTLEKTMCLAFALKVAAILLSPSGSATGKWSCSEGSESKDAIHSFATRYTLLKSTLWIITTS